MIVKQMVPAESVRAFAEAVDPDEARWIDTNEPCYLVMAHLRSPAAARQRGDRGLIGAPDSALRQRAALSQLEQRPGRRGRPSQPDSATRDARRPTS